jgi:hypothetical protein
MIQGSGDVRPPPQDEEGGRNAKSTLTNYTVKLPEQVKITLRLLMLSSSLLVAPTLVINPPPFFTPETKKEGNGQEEHICWLPSQEEGKARLLLLLS